VEPKQHKVRVIGYVDAGKPLSLDGQARRTVALRAAPGAYDKKAPLSASSTEVAYTTTVPSLTTTTLM
jgi:hypothetical protein